MRMCFDVPRSFQKLEKVLFFDKKLYQYIFLVIISILTVATESYIPENRTSGFKKNAPNDQNVCMTKGCIDAAEVISGYMDTNFDPCKNFYGFTCGGFYKQSKIPEDTGMVSPIILAQKKVEIRLKSLLEEEPQKNEPRIFELIKKLYQTCVKSDELHDDGDIELKEIINKLGGWPVVEGEKWNESSFDWVEMDIKLRSMGYIPRNIFNVVIQYGYVLVETTQRPLLHINPMVPHIDPIALKLGRSVPKAQFYLDYMLFVAKYFNATDERARIEMEEVFDFETRLSEVARLRRVGNESLKNVLVQFKNLQEDLPSVPWEKYIYGLTHPVINSESFEDLIIKLANPYYISNVKELLETTPKRTLANYMIWRTIASSVPYVKGALRAEYTEYFRDKINSYTTESDERWRHCVQFVSSKRGLTVGVSALYVRKYFDNNSIPTIEPILKAIHVQFERTLDQVSWMDPESKEAVKRKSIYMRRIIAYPNELVNDQVIDDYCRNLTFGMSSFFKNILKLQYFHYNYHLTGLLQETDQQLWVALSESTSINAEYRGDHNLFILLAGILQKPIFDDEWPYYAKFGSIGFIIAHEIMHAFDRVNIAKNEYGKLRPILTTRVSKAYKMKTDCYIKQYNHYRDKKTGIKVDGEVTLNENIADNIGLKVAHCAFKTWQLNHPNEPRLPGLNLSPEQIFWMTSIHFLCNKNTLKFRTDNMRFNKDPHALNGFRARGSISNSYTFPKAFNCSQGSPMNPKHKCRLW